MSRSREGRERSVEGKREGGEKAERAWTREDEYAMEDNMMSVCNKAREMKKKERGGKGKTTQEEVRRKGTEEE